jgi:hypothetical protein
MCSIAAEGSKASTITFMLQVQSGSVYSLASAPETRQSIQISKSTKAARISIEDGRS